MLRFAQEDGGVSVRVNVRVNNTPPCLKFAADQPPLRVWTKWGPMQLCQGKCQGIAKLASDLWGWVIMPTGEKMDLGGEGHMSAIQEYAERIGETPEDLGMDPPGMAMECWYTWFLKKGGLMVRGFGPTNVVGGGIDIDFHSEGLNPKNALCMAQDAIWDALTKQIMDWEVRMVDWNDRRPFVSDGRDDIIFNTVREFLDA